MPNKPRRAAEFPVCYSYDIKIPVKSNRQRSAKSPAVTQAPFPFSRKTSLVRATDAVNAVIVAAAAAAAAASDDGTRTSTQILEMYITIMEDEICARQKTFRPGDLFTAQCKPALFFKPGAPAGKSANKMHTDEQAWLTAWDSESISDLGRAYARTLLGVHTNMKCARSDAAETPKFPPERCRQHCANFSDLCTERLDR